jgi:hypothetical protein
MTGHPDETWEAWSRRIAGELAGLGHADWLTFTVHVDSTASAAYAAEQSSHTWRRPRGQSGAGKGAPDVFVQARLLEGVLALECIADTEFEGLTDLSPDQKSALVSLGWEPDDDDPDYARTFAPDDAAAAADLVARTLRDVLRAENPSRVDVRRRDGSDHP